MTSKKIESAEYLRAAVFAIAIGASPAVLAFSNGAMGELPSEMAGPTLTSRPPAVGSLSGVHIAIPHEYLFFGVTYKGESTMDPKPREKVPDLNTSIENFSLLLHLPDLQPRHTPQDEKLWESQMSTYSANFTRWWLSIGVQNITFKNHGSEWVKSAIGRYLDMKNMGGDVYGNAPGIDGLNRMITTRLGPTPSFEIQHDLLYDKNKKTTLITCKHMRRNVEPHDVEVECTQKFYLDDLHVIVDISYDDIYLKNWKLYQQKVTDLLRSFVVDDNGVSLFRKEER